MPVPIVNNQPSTYFILNHKMISEPEDVAKSFVEAWNDNNAEATVVA